MCTGVIGHCQCLRCVDHPAPGKLLRVDFCPEQQNKLAGVWVEEASSGHEQTVAACDKLTFKRVGEPGACHFEDADTKMKDNDTEMKDVDDASGAGSASGPGIAFTPINAAAIAQAALSIANNANNINQAQEDKTAATAGDNDQDNAVNTGKATPTTTSISNPDNDNATNMAQEQANPSPTSATPNNSNKKTPTLTLTQPQIQTNTTNNNTNTAPNPAVPHTPTKKRTPLPDSRPRTPRVAKATADALAAEAAARAASGEWTHAETIKLLLLRVKEVGLEEEDVIGRYLPGRDSTACAERLLDLARKHGYGEDVVVG